MHFKVLGEKGAKEKEPLESGSLRNKLPLCLTKLKRPKVVVAWKHRFACLADRKQLQIPTTDAEKDQLCRAGLSEKNVEF